MESPYSDKFALIAARWFARVGLDKPLEARN